MQGYNRSSFGNAGQKKCLRLLSRRLLVLVVLYEGQHLTHIYNHCVLVTNVCCNDRLFYL